jgi:hypothetical protein
MLNLDKKYLASDYEDEGEEQGYKSFDDVVDELTKSVNYTFLEMSKNPRGLIDYISELEYQPTVEEPIFFSLRVQASTRYNGGYPRLDAFKGTKDGEYLLNHLTLDYEADKVNEYCNELCATTIPFSLIHFLISIFGPELNFDTTERPNIQKYLEGKVLIEFCVNIDLDNDGEGVEEFNTILNLELKRWFTDQYMTKELFIQHAMMFMIPVEEDSSSS